MKKQFIITERAHLMCPNMQFGIYVNVKESYDEKKLKHTLFVLQQRHPFLHSKIAKEAETGKLYYDTNQEFELENMIREDETQLLEDYKTIVLGGWNVYEEGLLKILIYPNKTNSMGVLFIAHHLLCDGRGLLGLMNEFVNQYVEGDVSDTDKDKEIKPIEEVLIQKINDLPPHSELPLLSKLIIRSANKNWEKEKHVVDYTEYVKFEKQFLKDNPVTYEVSTKDDSELTQIIKVCKQNQVSLNDYLVAEMMLTEHTSKVVIAADIREQLSCYKQGALGNYATAAGVVSKKKTSDVIEKAIDVKKQIRNRMKKNQSKMQVLACYLEMNPELIDAVAISTLGNYESKAGRFVGSKMFGYQNRQGYCITNLGKIENSNLINGMFIPPASPANKVTIGALTVNRCMTLCKAQDIRTK